MTAVHTVPAVTAALIGQGVVTVITAAERGTDGCILIRADLDAADDGPGRIHKDRGGTVHIIHPGCIVASATVEWVPINAVKRCNLPDHEPHICRNRDDIRLFGPRINPYGGIDLYDQLPWGDFTPGRWAGILTDVQPTTERCPACWGHQGPRAQVLCRECCDAGTCPPIPCDNVKEWP